MGAFITFEGLNGCGKTSIIEIVSKRLSENGFDVVCFEENENNNIYEQTKNVIDSNKKTIDHVTEALLHAAYRNQNLKDNIIPNLSKNKVVLCERFVDTSYVYQGIAKNFNLDDVMVINNVVVKGYMPDITFYIDVAPEKCMARIRKNNNSKSKSSLESLEFNNKVRDGYLMLCKLFKDRIIKISGEQSLDKVSEDIYEAIDIFLRGMKNEGIF